MPGFWKLLTARYGDAAGEVDEVRIDASTNALVSVSGEHEHIHDGEHYFVHNYQNLSINNVLDLTFLVENTTNWPHLVWKIITESETLWQIYENVVETNPLANPITPYNSNRNSANTSGSTLKYEVHANLAAANADTDVSGGILLANGVAGSGKDSGVDSRDNEVELKQNTLYCIRATASTAGYINYNMQWYEHTDKH